MTGELITPQIESCDNCDENRSPRLLLLALASPAAALAPHSALTLRSARAVAQRARPPSRWRRGLPAHGAVNGRRRRWRRARADGRAPADGGRAAACLRGYLLLLPAVTAVRLWRDGSGPLLTLALAATARRFATVWQY